ncbi:MAG: hypothetical protein NUW37_02745 [Planctomycetes bacterium]|nr:hypothetical protein [Planctomycetota bacterium]
MEPGEIDELVNLSDIPEIQKRWDVEIGQEVHYKGEFHLIVNETFWNKCKAGDEKCVWVPREQELIEIARELGGFSNWGHAFIGFSDFLVKRIELTSVASRQSEMGEGDTSIFLAPVALHDKSLRHAILNYIHFLIRGFPS